jgi:hypothetical protein
VAEAPASEAFVRSWGVPQETADRLARAIDPDE